MAQNRIFHLNRLTLLDFQGALTEPVPSSFCSHPLLPTSVVTLYKNVLKLLDRINLLLLSLRTEYSCCESRSLEAKGDSDIVAIARLTGQAIAALVASCLNLSGLQGVSHALLLGALFATLACIASFSRLLDTSFKVG